MSAAAGKFIVKARLLTSLRRAKVPSAKFCIALTEYVKRPFFKSAMSFKV